MDKRAIAYGVQVVGVAAVLVAAFIGPGWVRALNVCGVIVFGAGWALRKYQIL